MNNEFKRDIGSRDYNQLIDKLLNGFNKYLNFCYFQLIRETSSSEKICNYAKSMFVKFLNHSYSLLNLVNGTNIFKESKELVKTIYDKDSIFVITRAILENYITFFTIFISPKTIEDKYFKLNSFIYCENNYLFKHHLNLMNDNEFINLTSANSQKKTNDNILKLIETEISSSYNFILECKLFKNLSDSEKKMIIKEFNWKNNKSWIDLATVASFRKSYFNYTYHVLSSSSHSGVLSTKINNLNNELDNQYRELSYNTILMTLYILMKFILEYSELNDLKEYLKSQKIFSELINNLPHAITIGIFTNNHGLINYLKNY